MYCTDLINYIYDNIKNRYNEIKGRYATMVLEVSAFNINIYKEYRVKGD